MRYYFLLVGILLGLGLNSAYSQCRQFAKTKCKPRLENFIHDGNYNAVILNLGEEVELHKVFFGDQKYRIVLCPEEHLPAVHFKIMNIDQKIIYDNKSDAYADTYDFELDESATLKISIKFVKENGEKFDRSISGCVAMLFGLEM
nr:hypothetical protein [uncultured Marinifilum sp.]